MYDYRLVSAYMTLNMQSRDRQALTGHPGRRVYRLPAPRRAPRNDQGR